MAAFILPTLIPNLLWGESLTTAYFMAVVRYVAVLHFTWLVNSAAHFYGMKPYDYTTSEWGFSFNITTLFIDAMAAIGQAYDLRTASEATVKARAARTGVPYLTRQGITKTE